MKHFRTSAFLVAAATLLVATAVHSRGFRVQQIPNGTVNSCANCQVSAADGGPRNAFGNMVLTGFLDAPGNVKWDPELALRYSGSTFAQ